MFRKIQWNRRKQFFFRNLFHAFELSCIFTLIIINYFLCKKKYVSLFHLIKSYHPFNGQTRIHFDKFEPPDNFSYTNAELSEAIENLNLPTWSRSYKPCYSNESEITCSQIVSAWRTIKYWCQHISHKSIENRKFILTKHYFDGIGNRISIDCVVFLIALMSNRSMIVEGNFLKNGNVIEKGGNAYEYHPLILHQNETTIKLLKDVPPFNVQVFGGWWDNNYGQMFINRNYLSLDRLIYSTMMYTDPEMLNFILPRFGMHAVYFISNFLVRIPQKNLNDALSLIKNIPPSIRVFGVHLRYQFAGQFYSYGIDETFNAIRGFLKAQLQKEPTIFVFASDSRDVEIRFMLEFGKHTIKSKAIRYADYDHDSALTDVALLMSCNECLLTYRSTFSFTVSSRMGKRCWFVEKESPSVFQASNSQAGAVSALFHNWDVNDWQTNRRFENREKNEHSLRYFYKYLLL